jgi:hypothetical protein
LFVACNSRLDVVCRLDCNTDDTCLTNNSDNKKDIVYLVALPFQPDPKPIIGIAVYQSTNGGRTWGPPKLIHKSVDPEHGREDDKQWAVGDNNPNSPYFGNVYAVWDDGPGVGNSKLAFARTIDNGIKWIGTRGQEAGVNLPGIEGFSSLGWYAIHRVAWKQRS